MLRRMPWLAPGLALLLPACAPDERPASDAPPASTSVAAAGSADVAATDSAAVADLRDAIRRYDDALRGADTAAAGEFWADELVFVNPEGARLTRADRIANLGTGRTAFSALAHVPETEEILVYGDVAVYRTLLSIGGQYSGQPERGQFRALVVWVRRDGRWQQVANQLTPVN
jgi:ketosteroid isomerase-like protein